MSYSFTFPKPPSLSDFSLQMLASAIERQARTYGLTGDVTLNDTLIAVDLSGDNLKAHAFEAAVTSWVRDQTEEET